eukprot:2448572-Pyramimonas_sp.AAC.1
MVCPYAYRPEPARGKPSAAAAYLNGALVGWIVGGPPGVRRHLGSTTQWRALCLLLFLLRCWRAESDFVYSGPWV